MKDIYELLNDIDIDELFAYRYGSFLIELAENAPDVDTVLKAGMGLRYAALGPFGVADFGGLDTFNRINSYLNAELSVRKEGSRLLKEMVESGKLEARTQLTFVPDPPAAVNIQPPDDTYYTETELAPEMQD